MAPLGPWDGSRRVAVAVSGGADSMALALLARGWGQPLALVLDHGLRQGSAQEAAQASASLAALGIPALALALTGLHAGAGLAARARAARYGALEAAAAAAGYVDLLLGHHALDQAETVLMRRLRGSGPAGLAGMAAVAEGDLVRRVRPLLPVPPARLRATLLAAGVAWVEDPSNRDPASARTRLRAEIAGAAEPLLAEARAHGAARAATERAVAAALAMGASIHPEGYAVLAPGPIDPAALAPLLRAISGRPYAPAIAAVASLARALRPATLGGVQVLPAGRLGPGWLLVREAAAMASPVPLRAGALWDGRFRASGTPPPGATLGALGADAAASRRRDGLPAAVLRTLPAIRRGDSLPETPFLPYDGQSAREAGVVFRHCAGPACGAAFLA